MKLLLLMSLLIYSSIQTSQTDRRSSPAPPNVSQSSPVSSRETDSIEANSENKPQTMTPLRIFSQSGTEGRDVILACGNEGNVTWEKGTDERRSTILRAENGEITQRLRPDPENRYSVLTDLSLVIRSVSLSDSGIYYCNAAPVVNLTVNPAPPADQRSSPAPPNVSQSSPVSSRETDSMEANSENKPQTITPLTSSAATLTPSSTVINSEAPTTNSTAQSSSGSDDLSSSTAPPGVTCCSSVSSSKTHRARKRMNELPTPALKSTKASEKKTQSTQTERESEEWSKSNYLITIAVLVGVLLIILALFLQRCYFKRKAARATKTDHVYETINDAALTTQPASAPPKEYETIYVLAGDPDVIKLGLKNQSAASPLKPQAQSTENNLSEPLYSSIQELST
ncbi:uncharacterized protein LOC108413613 isoform X1 [Pygocentrus nattereri]|uniref:uncharacterized protein LOC108413613 isoform X1 n=1 Tax=Pygocentrus nattereri TaxID=42514 RepID=UPI001891691C|nr:uncharacterized protein LOC108413613 isoform X1 [Pygocentrus nattereri]